MYIYKLQNGLTINSDRLVDAVLDEREYPQIYIDTKLGILIEVPSAANLGKWVEEIGKTQRYLNLESFSDAERVQYANEFMDLILKVELPKTKIAKAKKILSQSGWQLWEEFLMTDTDGWFEGWTQYINDTAWDYVHTWLTENPYIKITAEFDDSCDCAICKVIKDGEDGDLKTLLKAFETEAVMKSVESQLTKQTKTKSQIKVPNGESDQAFVFKVSLNYSKPEIWRRIILPADSTFFDLHSAIQDAMGWADYHLHSFTFDTRSKGLDKSRASFEHIYHIALPDPEANGLDMDNQHKEERAEKLSDWFGVLTKQCIYTYDFGDSWDHTVLLEKTIPLDAKANYPQCTGGKNTCPPEDCGGVGGYEHLKQILADPKHEEHKDMLEWLGLETATEFELPAFDAKLVEFEDAKAKLKELETLMGI